MADFIIKMFPYLIGLSGVAASFYTIYRTINHQREIKSVEIKKEIRTKQLDDFIETYCKMIEIYESLKGINTTLNDTEIDRKYKNEKSEKILCNIEYLNAKFEMILSKNTEEQLKILEVISLIYIEIVNHLLAEDDHDNEAIETHFTRIKNSRLLLAKLCSDYVEKERTAIENLITGRKSGRFLTWLKKSWKEVGEYKG